MTATRRGEVRSSLLSCVVAVLALLAVFVMHGPSSDHSMLVPSAHMSHVDHTSMASSFDTAFDTAVDAPRAGYDMHQVADRSHARALAQRSSAADGHSMAHEDCVATLRSDAGHAPPGDAVVAVLSSAEPGAAAGSEFEAATRATRAPPRPPDLDGLCISRT